MAIGHGCSSLTTINEAMTATRSDMIHAADAPREIMLPTAFDCDPLLRRGVVGVIVAVRVRMSVMPMHKR